MPLIINNNSVAIDVLNNSGKKHSALAKSLEKLFSGLKINSSADDSEGYQIPERVREQIREYDQANYNAQEGRTMIKVAEGGSLISANNDTTTDKIQQIGDNDLLTFNIKPLNNGNRESVIQNITNVLDSVVKINDINDFDQVISQEVELIGVENIATENFDFLGA